MKMFFILAAIFIASVLLCVVVGNYSGGALYFYLAKIPVSNVTWYSLYDGIHLSVKDRNFVNAVWGAALAVWIIFLPVMVTLITIWSYMRPNNKGLHGNARFANNKELERFHYKGDYN